MKRILVVAAVLLGFLSALGARPAFALSAPVLSAGSPTQTTVPLSWTDGGNEKQYLVFRDSAQIATLGANVLSYTATGLTPATTYSFRVDAKRGGSVLPSNTVTVTTATPPPGFTVPDCTGTVDDSGMIETYIASVPDANVITFQPSDQCRIDGDVFISGRNGLTFDGNGTTFFRVVDGTPQQLRMWRFQLGSGLTLRNATIVGLNPTGALDWARAYEHGIAVYGTNGMTIANVTVRDTYGDGVVVQHWNTVDPANVTIRESVFNQNGRSNISVINGTNISILDSELRRSAVNNIDLEPDGDSQTINGVTISGNTIENTSPVGGIAFASHGTCHVDNVTISGNTMVAPPTKNLVLWSDPVIRETCVGRSSGWLVENNAFVATFAGAQPYVVRIGNRDDVTVRNNTFYFSVSAPNNPGYMVGLLGVNGGFVSGNTDSGPGATNNEQLFWDAACTNIWLEGQQVA